MLTKTLSCVSLKCSAALDGTCPVEEMGPCCMFVCNLANFKDRAANNYIELPQHSCLVFVAFKESIPLLPASFSLVSALREECSLYRRVHTVKILREGKCDICFS